ncbi:MAG TPA: hypothetical protein VKO35_13635, partial [Acidimicrobiia bacterium]|nr:hypothetical protein [Acidimicrobiia bacterium]
TEPAQKPTTSTTGKAKPPTTTTPPPSGGTGPGSSPAPTRSRPTSPSGPPASTAVGGLLLAPQAAEAPGPAPAPADPSAPLSTTSTTSGPARDLSPRVHGADKAGSGDAAPAPAAAETALPEQLALGDILPYTPTTAAAAPPDAPAPAGPAPAGEAVAEYGHAPHSQWPLVAGMFVTLAVLLVGGAMIWWRNRDIHYFPA